MLVLSRLIWSISLAWLEYSFDSCSRHIRARLSTNKVRADSLVIEGASEEVEQWSIICRQRMITSENRRGSTCQAACWQLHQSHWDLLGLLSLLLHLLCYVCMCVCVTAPPLGLPSCLLSGMITGEAGCYFSLPLSEPPCSSMLTFHNVQVRSFISGLFVLNCLIFFFEGD